MNKNNKGFTLIELLIVIAIIGLLAGIVLLSLQGARTKAKDARIIADMNQLRAAAEVNYADNDSSYANFASSDDYTRIINDIKSQNGGNDPTVHITSNAYCIYTVLNKQNTFWCIDSKGISKEYASTPQCNASSYACE